MIMGKNNQQHACGYLWDWKNFLSKKISYVYKQEQRKEMWQYFCKLLSVYMKEFMTMLRRRH